MSKESRLQSFLDKANQIHCGKFDYSEVNYTSQKDHVKIICPIHGEFLQTPDKHLNSKFGCPACSQSLKKKYERRKRKETIFTKEYAEKILSEKLPPEFMFDLSEYTGGIDGIVIVRCPTHGEFRKTIRNLIYPKGSKFCNKCHIDFITKNRTGSYEDFVCQSRLVHGNKYIYSEENLNTYKDKKSIVKIICEKHGEFTKRAQKHVNGQGCIECMYDNLRESGSLPGGYCETVFGDNPELKDCNAKLYYLSINNGKFYKIGITTKSTEDRIRSIKHLSKGFIKNCDIVYEFESTLYNCYAIEQSLLKTYSYARSPRRWSTEVFNLDIFSDIDFYDFCGSFLISLRPDKN